MKKAFKLAVLGVLVAIGASVGWLVFGEVRTSEAVHFDESVGMVHHQTERMSVTLADTRTVVDEDIASVTDITELFGRWTPRYNRANAAYVRFDAAINLAEERAEVTSPPSVCCRIGTTTRPGRPSGKPTMMPFTKGTPSGVTRPTGPGRTPEAS